jgi:hypothetical protein
MPIKQGFYARISLSAPPRPVVIYYRYQTLSRTRANALENGRKPAYATFP